MKKLFFYLALSFLLMFILFVIMGHKGQIAQILQEGNQFYREQNYEEALKSYKKGLKIDKEDTRLHYNLGNTCYQLKKYNKAVEHYIKTSKTKSTYLNLGNSYKRLGDKSQKLVVKIEQYKKALNSYKAGIKLDMEDKRLKFNYEYVKRSLDKLKEQKQEDQKQNNQDNNNKEENQNKSNNKEQNDKEQNDKQNKSGANEDKIDQQQLKEALQILKALEEQEKDSLKNNQNIIKGKNDQLEYDW